MPQVNTSELAHMPLNGGIDLMSLPYAIDNRVPNLRNMISYDEPALGPFPGTSQKGGALTGAPVVHLARFDTFENGILFLAFTTTNIYSWSESVGTWTDLGAYGPGTYQYCPVGVFALDDEGEPCYIFAYGTTLDVRKIEPDGVDHDLEGTNETYRAKVVGYLDNRLLLLNTRENAGGWADFPIRARWSAQGDITDWPVENYTDLTGDATQILGMTNHFGEYGLIYKQRSIYSIIPTGTGEPFIFRRAVPNLGPASGASIATFGSLVIFLGESGIYRYRFGEEPIDISRPVKHLVFDRIAGMNTDSIELCAGYADLTRGIYWLTIPILPGDRPNLLLAYHLETNRWFVSDYAVSVIGEFFTADSAMWDDYPATQINNMSGTYASYGTPMGIPLTAVADMTTGNIHVLRNNLYDYAGTAVTQFFETREWMYVQSNLRTTSFLFEAAGTSADLYYTVDSGDTWTFIETVSLTTTFKKYKSTHDIFGERLRYKFVNSTLGGWFKVRWAQPDVLALRSQH